MNDFTKEELTYIRDYIFNGAASIRLDRHDALRDKLQSLIDNYCEHEVCGLCNKSNCEECPCR